MLAKEKYIQFEEQFSNCTESLKELVNDMPDKGNTCGESQRMCLLQGINELEQLLNGTTVDDFREEEDDENS